MFEYPEFLSPVAFEFFGLAIRWYSLSYILGFTYFYIFAASHLNDFNLDKKKLDDLFFYLFLSVIIGGRLGYVIFYNFSFYSSNPLDILKVWEGGMSFHGALFGIILTTIIFTKIYSIKLFLLADLLSITAPLGIFLGRLSNFTNQELIGRKTDFFISIRYSGEEFYRHLSQIYEAVFEGLIPFIILFCIFKLLKKIPKGLITSIFLINYSIVRFLIEYLREPDIQIGIKYNLFTQGQILSIPILLIGLMILYSCLYNKK